MLPRGDLLWMSGMSNLTCLLAVRLISLFLQGVRGLKAGPLPTLYRDGGGEVNVRQGGLGRRGLIGLEKGRSGEVGGSGRVRSSAVKRG